MAILTLTFKAASPTPAGGYRVTYRPLGASVSKTVVVSGSPAYLDATACTDYVGTIEAVCDEAEGRYGSPVAFSGKSACEPLRYSLIVEKPLAGDAVRCRVSKAGSGAWTEYDFLSGEQDGGGTPMLTKTFLGVFEPGVSYDMDIYVNGSNRFYSAIDLFTSLARIGTCNSCQGYLVTNVTVNSDMTYEVMTNR